jgi:dihydrofolate synthase/folylpolyglutamate synthase
MIFNISQENIYQKSLDLVMGLADFERDKTFPGHSGFHIERMELLLKKLDNPHLKIPTIHVAGTKGKGSTSAMISQILISQGYKVGLYSSPHLHSVRERIKVDSELISEKDFSDLVAEIYPYVDWVKDYGKFGAITTFEIITAMSFVHFYNQKVDFQVIEVGLGGRLDATNVVSPEVSIITSLSIDHESVLGSNIQSIAKEKAGIIKKNIPVVVAPQKSEAKEIIIQTSSQNQADIYLLDEIASWSIFKIENKAQHGVIFTSENEYKIKIPLLGRYQFENAAIACVVSEVLNKKGFKISKKSIVSGISIVDWPGRMQILSTTNYQILVDGAHNLYSIEHLVKEVKENFCYKRIVLIFGALKGHNVSEILKELFKLDPIIIISSSRHPRALSTKEILEQINNYENELIFQEDLVDTAMNKAIEISNKDDLILGTGSLSIVAEIIEKLKGVSSERYLI